MMDEPKPRLLATGVTREEIAELRRLEAEATPGPWRHEGCGEVVQLIEHDSVSGSWDYYPGSADIASNATDYHTGSEGGIYKADDAALIAAMRNAIPSLLSAAERALELEEQVRELEHLDPDDRLEFIGSRAQLQQAYESQADLSENRRLYILEALGTRPGTAAANGYCGWDCEGYAEDPKPSTYWPGERDREESDSGE